MKKVLFSIAAAALALTSCVKENVEVAQEMVTFEVALEDVATRALGNGNTCDELVYEVYDADGDKVAALSKRTTITDGKATVTIPLAKGQTYSFAFWAQKTGTDYYKTTDLTRVEINYETAVANDETRDAFFAYVEPSVSTVAKREVTLKRPFAQLNLAVSDLIASKNAGIQLDEVQVVTESAAVLNVVTGATEGAVPVTFTAKPVYTDQTLTLENDATYDWLSMNYLLPCDDQTGNGSVTEFVEFTLTTNHDPIVFTLNATPLQRNWRTNIIATLTEQNIFDVVIDPRINDINVDLNKGEVETYGVTMGTETFKTINEALAVAQDNAVITLAAGEYDLTSLDSKAAIDNNTSIAIRNGVTIQAATGLTAEDVILKGSIGLCKGNLKNVTLYQPTAGAENLLSSAFNGDCTIEGVIFNCPAEGTVNAFKEYSGWGDGKVYNLTFKNCVFNLNGQRALQFDVMNVTVEGCTFDNPYRYVVQLGDYAKGCNLTFKNNTVKNYGSTDKKFYTYVQIADEGSEANNVVVLEGNTHDGSVAEKWQDFVIENTASNVEVYATVADGVQVVKGVYEISNAAGLRWFADEVNVNKNGFAGKNIKLTADIDLENKMWSPVGQTGNMTFQGIFDGANYTVKNLKVDERSDNTTYRAAGLFGWIEGVGEVKNVNIDGATIYGHHYAAAVLAYSSGRPVSGCTVRNATISCVFNTVKKDDGDKAAAIVGYTSGTVTDCKAYDCKIDAVRDAGQIAGAANPANVTKCEATNVTVSHNDSAAGFDYDKDGWRVAERLVGYDTTKNDNH